MRWLTAMVDRLIFTVTALVCMQLPGFIESYVNNLGTVMDQVQQKLNTWQVLANTKFNGDIAALITSYQSSTEAALSEQGDRIHQLWHQAETLSGSIASLENGSLWQQVMRLPMNIDAAVFQQTWQSFTWSVSLDMQVAMTAILLALALTTLGGWLFRRLLNVVRPKPHPMHQSVSFL